MVLENVGQNNALLFGGIDNEGGVMTDSYIFSFNERKWIEINPTGDIPTGVVYPMSASLAGMGKVILFGGKTQTNSWLGETYMYDYASNHWTWMKQAGKTPCQRTMGAMAQADGGFSPFFAVFADLNVKGYCCLGA